MKTEQAKRDELVKAVTAFDSWEDMVEVMKAGYVPTLQRAEYDTSTLKGIRSKRQNKFNERQNKLKAELLKAGYKYFNGSKTVG